MPETVFGLTALLRIATLPSNEMVGELKQRKFHERPGGPPPRLALSRAMRSVFYFGIEPEVAERTLLASVPQRQRDHIRMIFRRFCRIARHRLIRAFPAPQEATLEGPLGVIGVTLSPEISYHRGGNSYVVHHWATRNTPLNPRMRSVGYALMQQECRVGSHENAVMAFQDLVRPRFGSELDLTPASTDEVAAILEQMERVWIDLEEHDRPLRYAQEHGLRPLL